MASQHRADSREARFPLLWLVVMATGLAGSVAMREITMQNGLSAGAYWTGVLAFGLVFAAGAVPFFPRFNAWTEARKAAGKTAWWERLP